MSDVNPCFSQDIWFEILKNLPVKTLGKCRCVCKSWHSLITSSTFITTHLNNYTRNNMNTFLLYRKTMSRQVPDHEQYLFFLDSGHMHIPFQLSHTSIFHFKLHDLPIRQRGSFFVGSVLSLLCLSDKPHFFPTNQIMLWNPFLGKIINLPTSSLAATSGLISVLEFGYDSNKDDHRVVKITYSRGNNIGLNPLVEVYSVWKRIWKTIPADYLADNSISSLSFSHCFLNGVIHWLAFEQGLFNSVAKWVLLFNAVEETFQKTEFPEAIVKMLTGSPGLFEYKTKLSLLHCEDFECDMSTFAKCQIWVKEEESSWCMILNITVDGDYYLLSRLGYLDRDGKLFGFSRKSDKVMVFYDVIKRQFIDLGLHYSYDASSKFAAFTDSLVLLDQDTTDVTEMMSSKCTCYLQLEMN